MSKKKLIPFSYLPWNWFLTGTVREIAKAEYELTGLELEERLLDLTLMDDIDREIKRVNLRHKYNVLTAYERDAQIIKLNKRDLPNVEVELLLLALDKEHGKIDEVEYDKRRKSLTLTGDELLLHELQCKLDSKEITDTEFERDKANILKQPWVTISSIQPDAGGPGKHLLSLDWNSYFVEYLHAHGYKERTEEDTVNVWLADLGRTLAMEQYDANDLVPPDMRPEEATRPQAKDGENTPVIKTVGHSETKKPRTKRNTNKK